MQNTIDEIRRSVQAEEYDTALHLIEEIEKRGTELPLQILVLKGRCIQLGSESTPYELSDAEVAFKKALSADNTYVDAMLQLAWFYLNVHDDAQRAGPFFASAIEICQSRLTEAVVGMAKCLHETESKAEALKFLDQIRTNALDADQLQAEQEEIEASD